MEFDSRVTTILFLGLVGIGLGGTLMTPMNQQTVLMMVLPTMLVFGLIALVIGVKHGEYRARSP